MRQLEEFFFDLLDGGGLIFMWVCAVEMGSIWAFLLTDNLLKKVALGVSILYVVARTVYWVYAALRERQKLKNERKD